ncbi:MAG: hypothetical protein Kow0025_10490 [Thermodesulfovibrionales bacterium]
MAAGSGRKGQPKAVLFDFGGVLAEEGFREGLEAIAAKSGLDPARFTAMADDLIYETGYVTGGCAEAQYWEALRRRAGIGGSDGELRREILERFRLRPGVLELARWIRASGYLTGILSDQTNWLEEIEAGNPFFHYFDRVFNSYRLGKGKRDPSLYGDAAAALGLAPGEVLLIDDKEENIQRAAGAGLHALLYRGADYLRRQLEVRLSLLGSGAMGNMKKKGSPRETGMSDITGSVVRVRHATEGDMVFVEEKLRERHVDTGDLERGQFVVAWRDDEMLGFGRIRPVEGGDAVSCILALEEGRKKGVSNLILKHLVDYSDATTVYAVTDRKEEFSRLGFRECDPAEAERLDIVCKATEGECLMVLKKGEGVRDLAEGMELFNEGRYFEAHEAWEMPWLRAEKGSAEKLFIQGLIMVAGALDHYVKGEHAGTEKLLDKGLARLAGQRGLAMGMDTEDFLARVREFQEKFRARGKGIPEAEFPRIRA